MSAWATSSPAPSSSISRVRSSAASWAKPAKKTFGHASNGSAMANKETPPSPSPSVTNHSAANSHTISRKRPHHSRRQRHQRHPVHIRSQQMDNLHPYRRQQQNIGQPQSKLKP